MPIFLAILVLIIIANTLYVKNYKAIRNCIIKHKIKNKEETYRDIDVKYSPSIVSYLYNQKIEAKKDLMADIFNLYAKKIIDIRKKSEKEHVIIINDEKSKEISELYENDRYIIDTLFMNKEEFIYEKWIKKIISVYRNKINIKEKRDFNKILLIEIYILGGIYFALLILNLLFFKGNMVNFIIITTMILCAIFAISILNNAQKRDENIDMHLNKEAKKELEKWMKIENFIKSYTLLNEKEYEEIIIFEQYVPFAMVLDINRKYKKEIKKVLEKEKYKEFMKAANQYNDIKNIFYQYY